MGRSRGILEVWVTLVSVVPSQLLPSLPFCTGLGAERCLGPGKGLGRGWSPCDSCWLCYTCTFVLLGENRTEKWVGNEWGCFFPSRPCNGEGGKGM